MTGAIDFAASGFVGKWKTTDNQGKPFSIWLSDDGKAKGIFPATQRATSTRSTENGKPAEAQKVE